MSFLTFDFYLKALSTHTLSAYHTNSNGMIKSHSFWRGKYFNLGLIQNNHTRHFDIRVTSMSVCASIILCNGWDRETMSIDFYINKKWIFSWIIKALAALVLETKWKQMWFNNWMWYKSVNIKLYFFLAFLIFENRFPNDRTCSSSTDAFSSVDYFGFSLIFEAFLSLNCDTVLAWHVDIFVIHLTESQIFDFKLSR